MDINTHLPYKHVHARIGIFVFYHLLGWAPAPIGRLDIAGLRPETITGFHTVDSALTGNVRALLSSASNVVLPVMSLGLILSITVAKTARASMIEVLRSDYIRRPFLGVEEQRVYVRKYVGRRGGTLVRTQNS